MAEEKQSIFSKVGNFSGSLVVLLVVMCVVYGVTYFAKHDLLNNLNRVYDRYDKITKITTDYEKETITFYIASDMWFYDAPKGETYKLQQVYDSDLFVIDNTVWSPTLQDYVVHIPDTFPR